MSVRHPVILFSLLIGVSIIKGHLAFIIPFTIEIVDVGLIVMHNILFSLTPYSNWNHLSIYTPKNTRPCLWMYGQFNHSPNIIGRIMIDLNFFHSWNNASFGKCNIPISFQQTNTRWHVWNSRSTCYYLVFINYIVPQFIFCSLETLTL